MEMKIEGLLFLAKKEKTDENGTPRRDKDGEKLYTAHAVQISTGRTIKFTGTAVQLADLKPKDEFTLIALMGVYQGNLWAKAIDVYLMSFLNFAEESEG